MLSRTSFNLSEREAKDLFIAWLAISAAFAIVMGALRTGNLLVTLIVAAVTVGTGFLLHELAHKFVAQRFGCRAEFHANRTMLVLAVLMSFAGFVFAAPGAVYISGHISQRKNGIISVAGPMTNIVLSIAFIAVALYAASTGSGLLSLIGVYGSFINAWLALFNMIPFMGLDGSKVWPWNRAVYLSTVIIALALVFGTQVVL